MTSPYPDLVTPAQIQARMQRPNAFSGTELLRVQAVCEDASTLVRQASGQTWVDPLDPTQAKAPEIVFMIARRCAERAVRNPEGYRSEATTDYSYVKSRDASPEEGSLFLTAKEVADLKQAGGKLSGSLWTLGTCKPGLRSI